jgi:hypothetical protein
MIWPDKVKIQPKKGNKNGFFVCFWLKVFILYTAMANKMKNAEFNSAVRPAHHGAVINLLALLLRR